jgi:DNA-directed RNA polymerase subunit RPC12/RpoP
MPATISISCPECKKQLNLPETLKGKKIRCKDCGTVFPVTPAPAAAKPAAPFKAAAKMEEDEDAGSYGFASEDSAASKPADQPPPKPPPAAKKGDDDDEGSNPYGVTETSIAARCPHCAKKMESEDAIVCLHCGYNTQTRKRADTKYVYEITPQDRTMWLLPGVLNVLAILFLIGLDIFFVFGLSQTWKNIDEWTESKALSNGLCLWFVVGSMFAMWKCGRFAFTRLILHPTPPEVEKE